MLMGALVGVSLDHRLGPPQCGDQLARHSRTSSTSSPPSVIGGTSLSGGIGTIYGAMLGALVMQSLQSGMALLNVDPPVATSSWAPCWCSRSSSTKSIAGA